jgi:hypothetical protein
MEKQFIDLVVHVFTFEWAVLALPLSLVLASFTKRVVPGLIAAALAVVVHHVSILLLSGTDLANLGPAVQGMIPKLEPLSLAAEYVAYAFLIIVFSLFRQDLARPSVTD